MAAFVVHSQTLRPASFGREDLYSTCCQHRPNGDFPLCVSYSQARCFLLSPLALWLSEGLQTIAMKGQHQLGGERNQELLVNKRTKEQICCGWKASVFFSPYQTTNGKIPATAHFCLFLLPSQMFDVMALKNEGVSE